MKREKLTFVIYKSFISSNLITFREEMREMKNYLEEQFAEMAKKFDEARQAAIGDVITEMRGDLSNSIQFLKSIQAGDYSARVVLKICAKLMLTKRIILPG